MGYASMLRSVRPWFSMVLLVLLIGASVRADARDRGDAAADQGTPTISVQPAGLHLAAGETGTVQLWLDSAGQPVHGVSLELWFDADLLQVVEVRTGPLLGEGAALGKGSPRIDNRGGKVRFEAESSGRGSGGAVPDALCEVTLRMTDERTVESAPIRIHKATLLDAEGRKAGDVEGRHHGVVEQVRFEGARLVRDPRTGLPSQMVGLHAVPRLLADGSIPLTAGKADAVYLDFLGEHADLFGVDPSDLRLVAAKRIDEHWIVVFRQVLDTLAVHHVTVALVADGDGTVLAYHGNYVPDLSISTKVKLDLEGAADIAKATLEGDAVDAFSRHDAQLVVHVDRSGEELQPRLAWHFLLAAERPHPVLDTLFFVDAVDGTVLHSYPRHVPAVLRGAAAGEVLVENPDDPPVSLERLPYMRATVDRTGFTTDPNGDFALSGLISGGYAVDAALAGPFADVRDAAGREVTTTSGCATSSPCGIAWPYSDELNVFFHVNWMHDWYVQQLEHPWTNGWDGTTQLDAAVIGESARNAWAGETMLFGAGDFSRSSDVVYHECSHNVLYDLYGDWLGFSLDTHGEAYAMDEGFADYFAAAATGDPRIGEGAGLDRDLAAPGRYAGSAGHDLDGHDGGLLIGGAAWALRQRLMAELGEVAGGRHADRLLFEAHQRLAAQPRAFMFSEPHASNLLTSLYAADDTDDDPLDGSPHSSAIHRAFHGYGLLQAVLEEGDSYDASANLVGAWAGGDFYVAHGRLFADNPGQHGVLALGDVGDLSLDALDIAHSGHTRSGVLAVPGWTYLVRARDGDVDHPVALRVLGVDGTTGAVTIEYLVHDRLTTLSGGQSYDFSAGLVGGAPAGDLYVSGDVLAADRGSQRGIVHLGDLGDAPLERAISPPSGYGPSVPLQVGHTYVARASTGDEGSEVALRVIANERGRVTLEGIHRPINGVVVYDGDSYGFLDRTRGTGAGGELYLDRGSFKADRKGQRGIIDLGEAVEGPLHRIAPPPDGYSREGVAVVEGHTYAAQAVAEGSFVILRVEAVHGDAVDLRFEVVRPGFVTLYDGDGYDFAGQQRGTSATGDLYLAEGKVMADHDGQRGVIDLGELAEAALDAVAIPATGYSRGGVEAVQGHTYLAPVGTGAQYVALRLHEVADASAVVEWKVLTPGRVVLRDQDSFDFDRGEGATRSGGELYLSRGKFYANLSGQRGLLDLGDLGETALDEVTIPDERFSRYGLPVTVGHTYAALAGRGEEGNHVLIRVDAMDDETVTLSYVYRTP